MYSGPVAASAFYELAIDGKPDTVVLLGPNHTGYGSALAIMREGAWRTPLGDVEVDSAVADAILHETSLVDVDELRIAMSIQSRFNCLFCSSSMATHSRLCRFVFRCRITIQPWKLEWHSLKL